MKQLPIKTKKQRLAIYKKVLLLWKKGKEEGLCIDFKHQSGRDFFDRNLPETDVLFPEFGLFIKRYSPQQHTDLFYNDIRKWRKKVLDACIKICSE